MRESRLAAKSSAIALTSATRTLLSPRKQDKTQLLMRKLIIVQRKIDTLLNKVWRRINVELLTQSHDGTVAELEN